MLSELKTNYKLIAIMALGFLLRIAALIFYPDQNFPDAQVYEDSGNSFFATGIISSNIYMPLYIIWSHLMSSHFMIKVSDILFSTASIFLIYQITYIISKNKTAGLIAALIAAVYPYFIFYSVSRLTETSFVFFVLLAFYYLFNSKYVWASIILVLAILIRPTYELLNPILILAFGFVYHKLSFKQNMKNLGIYAAIYLILMSPWWVHNYVKYGELVRLNLGFGHVLYSGNNPINETGGGVSSSTIKEFDMSEFSSITNPVEHDKAIKDAAIKFIKENPEKFMKLAIIKFERFWRLWPFANEYTDWKYKIISLLSYGVVLVLSIIFALVYTRRYFPAVLPIYLMFGYLTSVHMILIGSIRYRFPLEPFMIMFAGIVLGTAVEKWAPKRLKTYL